MEKHIRIQFFIPTRNNEENIYKTLDSIWKQKYPKEDIFVTVMDFGSTDMTYELLLAYDPYHLGIYKGPDIANRRIMLEKIAQIGFINPGGWYSFKSVLYPGEILYDDYLDICVNALLTNQKFSPIALICEVDKVNSNDEKKSQLPLYDKDRIIGADIELSKLIGRGFQHQIQCVVSNFGVGLRRQVGQYNEQRWWNKLIIGGVEKNIVYVNKPLMIQRCIEYEDELEEILLRWESIIGLTRDYKEKHDITLGNSLEEKAMKNLGYYAIWRSYLLIKKRKMKEAEDCRLISCVICPSIKEELIYQRVEDYQRNMNLTVHKLKENKQNEREIDHFFEKNGWR